ncbi:MAG: phosphatase PAP2 family protein [Planctomycetota bacterium]
MTYFSPFERRDRGRRRRRALAVFIVALIVLTMLDPAIARAVWIPDREGLDSKDFYATVRSLGALWIWIAITLVIYLHDRVWDRAGSVFLATVIAGLVAEGVKRVIPRGRPVDGHGIAESWHRWRPLFSGFADDSNLGLPSSHAAVAFAGCLVLAAFLPRARWLLWGLAILCGFSRMASGAHFASDILVGGAIGWWWARFFEPPKPDRARLA